MNTPTQKQRKTELDYMKEKQIENLHTNNKALIEKMTNLMDLTKNVISKMQLQNMNSIKGQGGMSDNQSMTTESTIPNRPEMFEGEFHLRQYNSLIKQQQ